MLQLPVYDLFVLVHEQGDTRSHVYMFALLYGKSLIQVLSHDPNIRLLIS
jgi:hypothetical protein